MPDRYEPTDPREWLNRARSNLALAQATAAGVYLEELCFNAQQAAEKAVKAVYIQHQLEFAYVHDLTELLDPLPGLGVPVPPEVRRAAVLSQYAVQTRYPFAGAVSTEDYEFGIEVATCVVEWASREVQDPPD